MAIECTCLPAAANAEPSRQIGRGKTRLARGEELWAIAAHLRIKPGYLAALEDGNVAAMPGRPYASGFLRCYAGYLALDGNLLVAQLKPSRQAMAMPARPHLERRRSSWVQTVIMTSAALMLAGTLWTGERSSVPQLGGSAALVAEAPATASPVPNVTAAHWPVTAQAAAGDAHQPPLTMLVSSDSESGSVRSDQNAAERRPVPPVSSTPAL